MKKVSSKRYWTAMFTSAGIVLFVILMTLVTISIRFLIRNLDLSLKKITSGATGLIEFDLERFKKLNLIPGKSLD